MNNSQIMRTLHYLATSTARALTGSPNHKAAAEWAIKQMTEWGMTNGHLEPWDFGREGWAERVPRGPRHRALQGRARRRGARLDAGHRTARVTAKAFNLVTPDGPEAPPTRTRRPARAAAAAPRGSARRRRS